jgi:hypothetical protein
MGLLTSSSSSRAPDVKVRTKRRSNAKPRAVAPSTPPQGMRRTPRRRAWLLAAAGVLALAAGVITVWAGHFNYQCTLAFRIDGRAGDKAGWAAYRREMHEYIDTSGLHLERADVSVGGSVAADRPGGELVVTFVAPTPRDGLARIVHLAASYPHHLKQVAERARGTVGQGEMMLAARLADLRRERSDLAGADGPPKPNATGQTPLEQRQAVTTTLADRRNEYDRVHRELREALSRSKDVLSRPIPKSGRLDEATRHAAQNADVELTEDRAALTVQLAELRSQLLEVGLRCSPLLAELRATAAELVDVGDSKAAQTAQGAHRLAAERLIEAAAAYQRRCEEFAQEWTGELEKLRATEAEPHTSEIIDRQDRLTKRLGDFLFATVSDLSAMQEQIDVLSSETHGAARHLELISTLTRGFRKLRTDHHQFEFAASDIKPLNNFRLDAALKSAQGLARRVSDRVRGIDQRLEEQAYQQAVQDRDRELAALDRRIEELRQLQESHVAAMLEAQDGLTDAAFRVDDYLRDQFSEEQRGERMKQQDKEITSIQAQLDTLAANRPSPVDPDAVTVLRQYVDPTPINLKQRLAYGGLVTATMLLVLMLGHRLVTGRGARP